jgi:BirA family biotin operon repressor/biotin-[acetyl-CoA-carboxylase] ligase
MKTKDLQLLKKAYENLLANLGQPVRVLSKNPFEGVALGINAGGELLVRREDDTVVAVNSGEVSVRGLYSYV